VDRGCTESTLELLAEHGFERVGGQDALCPATELVFRPFAESLPELVGPTLGSGVAPQRLRQPCWGRPVQHETAVKRDAHESWFCPCCR
jgi:hypothetical protein